ncbi:MAG: hypothetical protein ABIZ04_16845 [Opitutus sp.]
MLRLRHVTVLLPFLAGLTLAGTSQAQSPSPVLSEKPDTPTSPPPKPKRDRPISDGVANALAASMPKYSPPPKPVPVDEDVDLRDVDKPKNGIIRLPKYTVQEKKPPVFRERDIFTSAGLASVARDRYITATDRVLNRVTLPLFGTSSEARALAMYAEDERLNNMSDLKDTAKDVSRTDPNEGAYIKRVTDQTYMRDSGFGYDSRAEVRR